MDLKTFLELKNNAAIYFPTLALAYVADKTNDGLVFAGFIIAFIFTAYYARIIKKTGEKIPSIERTKIVKLRDSGQKDEALQLVMTNSWREIQNKFTIFLSLYVGVIGSYFFALTSLTLVFDQFLAWFLFAFGALVLLAQMSFILRNTLKLFVVFTFISDAIKKKMTLKKPI